MATIKDNEHQPDIEGNSKNGLDGSLPDAGCAAGMDADAAFQGCDRDCASEGFHSIKIAGSMADQREGDELGFAPTQSGGGFAGRPGGWDR